MSIDYRTAIGELTSAGANNTVASLFDLVGRVTGKVSYARPGDTYLLFSGLMPDGVTRTGAIAAELVSQGPGNVYDIGTSEVGKLLDDLRFNKALEDAVSKELFGIPASSANSSQILEIQKQAKLYKEGVNLSGERISATSLWDIASHNFVAEANGNFRVIAPRQLADLSVFVTSELPALLENPNIGFIDGVPRESLLALRNSRGLDAVRQIIVNNSLTQVVYTGLSETYVGEYLSVTPESLSSIPRDSPRVKVMNDYLAGLSDAERTYLRSGQTLIRDLGKAGTIVGTTMLKVLGPVSILLGLGLAARDAAAAESEGRHEDAKEIIKLWAVDLGGSTLGQFAAGAVAALGAAALVSAGVLTAPVAGAIVLGATLLGGYFGGDGAKELYQLLKDRDENGRRDIFDKLSNLFFGATWAFRELPDDFRAVAEYSIDASLSRDEIVDRAKSDIAWRYALRELNSFVVPDADYAKHDGDASLDLYNEVTGVGTMTERFLADRAAMLSWLIQFEVKGARDDDDLPRSGSKPYNEEWDTWAVNGNWDYVDLSRHLPGGAPLTLVIDGTGVSSADHQVIFGTSSGDSIKGKSISDWLYGMSGNDSIDGLDGDDYVEGDAGNDLLSGGNGTDTLVGGAGDDTLDGGSGDDSLTGGVGNDAYFFSTGWGNDVIYDVDGNGTLRLPGYDAGLPAGQRLNSNQWSDANRKVFYTLVDGEQGKRDLIISFADRVDTVRVRDWAPARSFGIVLPDVPTSPPTTNTFTGDFHKKAGTSGLYAVGVDYNYVSDGAQPDAPDSIVGTTQADRMLGLGGNDLLMGLDGNDLLDGGAGDDLLLGGMGANTIFGGDGNDFIYGSGNGPWNFNAANRATPPAVTAAGPELARGFDWVAYNSLDMNVWSVAGIANPATVVSPEGDVLDGGAGNDHIVGGVGRDFIVGGTGNDFVYGLLGNDVISGGDGNDSLTGDGPAVVGLNLSMPANQNGNDLIDGGAGKDLLVGEGGNDTLNGGTDDDVLWGDGSYDGETPAQYSSSDILDGGDGNDWMSGGGGGDELRGGSGDDLMWGDYTQAAIDPAFHGADTLDGGDGNDTMMGAGGDDFLYGGAGNDAVWGDAPVSMLSLSANGNDFIDVGDGDDAVEGGGGSDTILGGMGVDTLSGNEGNDFIAGGSGDDKIYGNDGNDTLEGGGGTDYLEGGLGDDVYVIGRGDMPADATGKVETIVDGGGNDTVVLEGIGSHDIAGVVIGDSSLLLSIVGGDSVIADTAVERFSLSDRSTLGMAEMAGHYALTPGNVHLDNGRTGVLGGLRDDNIVYADSAGGGLTVSGGRGNDNINIGGSGNTYLFGRGDGSDVVADGALLADGSYGSRGASRIVFSEGISAADIRLAFNPAAFTTTCDTTPLFVQLAGTGDQIGISGFKGDITAPLSIDRLVFGDGSEVTLAQLIASNGFDIAGTDATDTLQGTAAVDHINGGGGDDHLVGGKGDDVLDGGAGNDSISPGEGNDRILFGRGDGKDDLSNDSIIGDGSRADVLEFKAGVAPSDVIVRTLLGGGSSGSSGVIELAIAGTNDSIAVRYKFGGDAAAFQECAIQQVKFADGTVWSSQDIAARLCQGAAGDDRLVGTKSGDSINGYAGADTVFAGAGDDTISGGSGNDTLSGEGGNDVYLFGRGDGNDVISQDYSTGSKLNVLQFKAGLLPADVTALRSGQDLLLQIAGSADSVLVSYFFLNDAPSNPYNPIQQIRFGDGTTWSLADIASRTYVDAATAGADTVHGTIGSDVIDGKAGADTLYGDDGNDTLIGGMGNDYLVGGRGNDVFTFNIGDGADNIDATDALSAVDTLRFGAGIAETDVRPMRSGNHLFFFVKGNADQVGVVNYFAAGTSVGGVSQDARIDRVEFASGAVWDQAMIQTMMDRVANNHAPTINTFLPTLNARADNAFSYVVPANTIVDADSWDSITYSIAMADGTAVPSWLHIDAATRTLYGTPPPSSVGPFQFVLWGTDVYGAKAGEYLNLSIEANRSPLLAAPLADLSAAQGAPLRYTVAASSFSDPDGGALRYAATLADGTPLPGWLVFDPATRTFSGTPATLGTTSVKVTASDAGNLSASDVFDIVVSVQNLSLSGSAASDTLTGGTGNDSVLGLGADDLLVGNAGNDTLDGGGGVDTMQGGAGDDIYVVDNASDVIVENAGEGVDKVNSSLSWTLGANVEQLTLTGSSAINGVGNTLDNRLVGNGAANSLTGGAGNDTVDGQGGADTLVGGAGDDVYVVDNAADVITEVAGEGTDRVFTWVNWTLGAELENLTLSGTAGLSGTGNALNNYLIGNSAANMLSGGAGNDTLDGVAGADTLVGGTGDDAYVVDNVADVIVENAGEGTDRVVSSVNWTLGADLENLTLSGTAGLSGTGNALNNYLIGNSAANTLTGGGGNDTLDGLTGTDTMIGGSGDDVYYVDTALDVIVENVGEGLDKVNSSLSWTLGANVEQLTLTGSSAINGVGNTLDNRLVGNGAANSLTGGAGNDTVDGQGGADTLVGGAGDDVYVVDNAADVVTEVAGEGTDRVFTWVNWTLGAELENLTLSGAAGLSGTGNALNNSLIGNSAANVLSGGAGNDTLDGQAGADTLIGGTGDDAYVVDNVADVITENVGEGIDRVVSSVSWTLGSAIENLTLTGTSGLSGTGNALNNYLIGNSAANTLTGGAGNDILDGQAGADTLVGGLGDDGYIVDNASDVIAENVGEGIDRVSSALSWTLGANVENLTLSGAGSINGTGNSLSNWLTGNAGSNVLSGLDGNDRIDGGAGNDTLIGGLGSDVYMFGKTYGVDTVQENDASAGVKDRVEFGTGIATGDTSFVRSGNDLQVLIAGTADKLVLQNWYLGNSYHVEEFAYKDGTVLTDAQVQGLVSAMAAFAAPASVDSRSSDFFDGRRQRGDQVLAANAIA